MISANLHWNSEGGSTATTLQKLREVTSQLLSYLAPSKQA